MIVQQACEAVARARAVSSDQNAAASLHLALDVIRRALLRDARGNVTHLMRRVGASEQRAVKQ